MSNQEKIRQDLQDLQDGNRKIILLILSKTCLLVISNNVYCITTFLKNQEFVLKWVRFSDFAVILTFMSIVGAGLVPALLGATTRVRPYILQA